MIREYRHSLKPDVVLWQDHPDDGVGEPAIALYCDSAGTLTLEQGRHEILVSETSIDELVSSLRRAKAIYALRQVAETKKSSR